MSDKPIISLETFIENVSKKNKKHNGLKVQYNFVKRKRK